MQEVSLVCFFYYKSRSSINWISLMSQDIEGEQVQMTLKIRWKSAKLTISPSLQVTIFRWMTNIYVLQFKLRYQALYDCL